MSWIDQSANPLCYCGHLWSNHRRTARWDYLCYAPDCECNDFIEDLTEGLEEINLEEERRQNGKSNY